MKILGEVGIRVESALVRREFKAASGVTFRDDRHVTLQLEIVEWAIQAAPATIDIYNRTGEQVIHLGNDSTRFGIGVTNLFYQDPATSDVLPFSRDHLRRSVGLGNQLNSYDVISTIGILRDVETNIADLVALIEMMADTIKPLIVLISDEKQFLPGIVLLEQLVGDLAL